MGIIYLLCLSVAIACLLLVDFRYRLFFWHSAPAAWIVTAVGIVLLMLWDVGGIIFGVFIRGGGEIATGIVLFPEMPLEEPFFLLLLVLSTMTVFTGTLKFLRRNDTVSGEGKTQPVEGVTEPTEGVTEPTEGKAGDLNVHPDRPNPETAAPEGTR